MKPQTRSNRGVLANPQASADAIVAAAMGPSKIKKRGAKKQPPPPKQQQTPQQEGSTAVPLGSNTSNDILLNAIPVEPSTAATAI